MKAHQREIWREQEEGKAHRQYRHSFKEFSRSEAWHASWKVMLSQERLLWGLWLLFCKKGEMRVCLQVCTLPGRGKERVWERGTCPGLGWSQQAWVGSGPKRGCQVGTGTKEQRVLLSS